MLEFGNFEGVSGSRFEDGIRNDRRFAALLAVQRHAGSSGVDDERGRAMGAGENDVVARILV